MKSKLRVALFNEQVAGVRSVAPGSAPLGNATHRFVFEGRSPVPGFHRSTDGLAPQTAGALSHFRSLSCEPSPGARESELYLKRLSCLAPQRRSSATKALAQRFAASA